MNAKREKLKYTEKDLDLHKAVTMTLCFAVVRLTHADYVGAFISLCGFPLYYFLIRSLTYFRESFLEIDKSED